jgi:hypothetical protein
MGFIERTLDRIRLEYFLENSVNKQQITGFISIYVLYQLVFVVFESHGADTRLCLRQTVKF